MVIRVMTVTNVTIRGIDDAIYREFSAEARRREVSIGKLTSEAMREFLSRLRQENSLWEPLERLERSYLIVAGVNDLVVSKRDLDQAGKPVVFMNIKKLTFKDDVDKDTFERSVYRILECKEVSFPPIQISKLNIYSKCHHCNQVIVRTKT